MDRDNVIIGNNIEIHVDVETLEIVVKAGSMTWVSDRSSPPSLTLLYNGREHVVLFNQAKNIHHDKWQKGIGIGLKTTYSGFELDGKTISLEFQTIIWLDNSLNDVHFEFISINDNSMISRVAWPGPFEFASRQSTNYTVIPMRQGVIIPNNWDDKIDLVYDGQYYCMGFYMPWWGQIQGSDGYIAIIETPWDAACSLQHPPGGPTSINTIWTSSLGSMRYKRKVKYTFLSSCDYNTLCKVYRDYIRQQGRLITLREKLIRNPKIGKLIGTYVVHDFICYYIKPTSIFYKENTPENNYRVVRFSERANQLKALKAKGVEKVYFHMDGWGRRGYDNLHPDVLPPCEAAGGWEGMCELANTCNCLGYLIAIHDEYMDCYTDAESYNPEQSVHNEHGEVPHDCIWFGGEQALLCPEFACRYLMRNLRLLKENGVILDGIYLDIFSAAPLVECFHPEHRVTRYEGVRRRIECFEYCRSQGMLVSSEECADWAIPHLDLVHHAPYPLSPKYDDGKARGIPVPLFNLVYHDCLIIPWNMRDGFWGIPKPDSGFLHGMLNGGIPYLSINADHDEIAKCKVICDLHERIGMSEMLRHEFVNGDYRIQKTIFADGTQVCVNFDTGEYSIG